MKNGGKNKSVAFIILFSVYSAETFHILSIRGGLELKRGPGLSGTEWPTEASSTADFLPDSQSCITSRKYGFRKRPRGFRVPFETGPTYSTAKPCRDPRC